MTPPTITEDEPTATTTTAAVDPRFEARRAAVEKDERRRRRSRIIAALATIAIVAGSFAITRSPFADVDAISVTGWSQGDRAEIITASGIALGTPLTDIDTEQAARRVEQLVPWVAAARVTRSWPSSVRIIVVERRPVAQIQSDDGHWLPVDASGHLLDANEQRVPELKAVEGVAPGAQPGSLLNDAAARGVGVLAQMSPGLASRVTGIRFRDSDVELVLAPTGTVAFGPADQVQMKLLALETVLARVDQRCVVAIDVRVPRRPLVKRDFDCFAQAEG